MAEKASERYYICVIGQKSLCGVCVCGGGRGDAPHKSENGEGATERRGSMCQSSVRSDK